MRNIALLFLFILAPIILFGQPKTIICQKVIISKNNGTIDTLKSASTDLLTVNIYETSSSIPLYLLEIGDKTFSYDISNITNIVFEGRALIGENVSNGNIPSYYELLQNYPNPFNPSTVISYRIPEKALVEFKVYDILGREVSTLVKTEQIPGEYKVQFDGSNLSSGVYLYRIQAGKYIKTRKMLLIK